MNKDKSHNIDWDIIIDILNETASNSQKQEFKNWLDSDDSNLEYFNQIEKVWLKTGSISHLYSIETNNAWEEVKSLTIQKDHKPINLKRRLLTTISIAASLLIIFFIGKNFFNPEKFTISTSNEMLLSYNLPDNSTVDINSYSTICFTKNFNRNKREVWLTGEAFFDVEKMENKPFIIHTKSGSFKVLGTSFNISSYEKDSLLSLHVKTGIVEFFPKNLKGSVKIKKGEQINYNKAKGKFRKTQNISDNYIAWKTKNLTFDNESLEDIAKILEKVYAVKIIFENDNLKQLRFTGDFKNQSLDKIIKVIALTFELDTEQSTEQIKLLKIKNEQITK